MLRVGLTGGVASGKSEVARLLAAHGAAVLDADAIVERLYRPRGAGALAVAALFGPEVLTAEGAVDRGQLARRVLCDPPGRRRLEAAIHPLVRGEIARWFGEQEHAPEHPIVAVVEAALLVETGSFRDYDLLVVVTAPLETRRARARAAGWDGERFERLASVQTSDTQREAVAHHLVRNEGDLTALQRAVEALWCELSAAAGHSAPASR